MKMKTHRWYIKVEGASSFYRWRKFDLLTQGKLAKIKVADIERIIGYMGFNSNFYIVRDRLDEPAVAHTKTRLLNSNTFLNYFKYDIARVKEK